MTVRDDVHRLIDDLPDERLADVCAYLKSVHQSDAAWEAWEAEYGSPELDEYVRQAVREAREDPRPGIPHEDVVAWLESWGTDHELPPPIP